MAAALQNKIKIDRIYYLDLIKVISCFLVVYAHLFSGGSLTCKYIYAFHVPLFFIVSGVFHHSVIDGRIEWRSPILTLIIPTILFIFIDGIAYSIQYGQERGFVVEMAMFAKTIILGLVRGSILGPYWFLIALFWCRILTDVFLLLKRNWLFLLAWASFLVTPLIFDYRLPLLLSQGLMALPFYLTGFFCGPYMKKLQPNWRFLLLVLPCLFLTGLLSYLNGKVSMNGVYFGSMPFGLNILVFYINAAIGSLLVFAISLLPFPQWNFVSFIGESLITIVGLQMVFIRFYHQIIGPDQNVFISTIAAILILLLCSLLHQFLNPIYQKIRNVLPARRPTGAS